MSLSKISNCLWFDNEAEDAATFYCSIFKNSSIKHVQRYTEVGKEFHGKEPGSVQVVQFVLDGHTFVGLNGGKSPGFEFNGAISFQIDCKDQVEVDHFWEGLSEGGDPSRQRCGWLSDKYGISWQVIPSRLFELLRDPDPDRVTRASGAMFTMKKLDIAALEKAADGA